MRNLITNFLSKFNFDERYVDPVLNELRSGKITDYKFVSIMHDIEPNRRVPSYLAVLVDILNVIGEQE